jgi:hypothetical protein
MKKILNVSFIIALITILGGCELLKFNDSPTNTESNNINYTQYYLLLSELNDEEITEHAYQHQLISQDKQELTLQNEVYNRLNTEQQLKSVMLFSLPDSPIYNPFTAKSKLNQLSLKDLNALHLTDADFAFFNMLKTQLNQQILLLNQLSAEKNAHHLIKKTYQQKQHQYQELQQQIIQLKKIESNINEHGQ